MAKRRKQLWYQYTFEDVFGKEWKISPVLKREQISMGDLYDGSVLGVENEEERYRRSVYGKLCRICVRTIISGDQVECDIYPVWGKHDVPRGIKSRESRAEQKNLNRKNSVKTMVRYMQANFTAGDLIMTLTYDDHNYPSKERAEKDINNFLTAIRRARKKEELDELKYIYVIEYVSDPENTKKVRVHHHLIMNAMDRDLAESKWKKGRVNARYADPDSDFGLEGFGRYIGKTVYSKGEHSWSRSRNLKKPIVHESTTKLTRRKMYEMVHSGDGIGEMMEQMYKGRFRYLTSRIYCSDYVGGYYIYGRLRKKEGVEIVEETKPQEKREDKPTGSDQAAGEDRPTEEEQSAGTDQGVREKRFHTDIYINAVWHGDPDAQTLPADGEYAATNEVKTKDGRVHNGNVYGAWSGTDREGLYLRALLDALSKYTMPCDITAHCDNTTMWSKISKGIYAGYTENDMEGIRNAVLVKRLQSMLKLHDISVELEAKNKHTQTALKSLKEKMDKGIICRKENNQ